MIQSCLFLLAGVYALQLSSFVALSDLLIVVLFGFLACLSHHTLRSSMFVLAGAALFMTAALDVVDSRLEPQFSGDSMLTRIRVIDFPKLTKSTTVSFVAESINDNRVPSHPPQLVRTTRDAAAW